MRKQILIKLISIQKNFLLQISRGYQTISTDVLNILTGNPPITITIKFEYNKTSILQLKQENITNTLLPNTIIKRKVHGSKIQPVDDFTFSGKYTMEQLHPATCLISFTDMSRIKTGMAADFCVTEGSEVSH